MVKDLFSKQAKSYARFRPHYPEELFELILSEVQSKEILWDCGTGNGQAAVYLSNYFKKVYASDISINQLKEAEKKNNIHYTLQEAEKTNFPDKYFDLITVAQAVHWFDLTKFYEEVNRVGSLHSVIAIWGYGLFRIEAKIDEIIDDFYFNIIGNFWDKGRVHIDSAYDKITFPFENVISHTIDLKTIMDLSELQGYLNSWSAVQKFKRVNQNNPVRPLILSLSNLWKEKERKLLHQPLFLKMGKIHS